MKVLHRQHISFSRSLIIMYQLIAYVALNEKKGRDTNHVQYVVKSHLTFSEQ